MKIAVLTSQTRHHAYFVRALAEIYTDVVAFCETGHGENAFLPAHPFEDARDRYERNRWFGNEEMKMADLVPTHNVVTMNSPTAVAALKKSGVDIAIVFGTGLLQKAVTDSCPRRIFNLHGGGPEQYRGLDTHLWAVFHRDVAGLLTTLHRVDLGLDTGDIIVQARIPVTAGMQPHALRAVNAEICVRLCTAAIDMIQRHGDVVSRPQRTKGRYYSAMPAELKSACIERFDAYTKRLEQ